MRKFRRKFKNLYNRYDYAVGDNFGPKGSRKRKKWVRKIMWNDRKNW